MMTAFTDARYCPPSGGAGAGTPPQTFVVGITPGAPDDGSNAWINSLFVNKGVAMDLNNVPVPVSDPGNGDIYTTKSTPSDTLVIMGHVFTTGDVITVYFF